MDFGFESISNSLIYQIIGWYLAAFPLIIAALSVNSSRMFLINRFRAETESANPHQEDLDDAKRIWPVISIVIPARDEEDSIERTVRAANQLIWPKIEIIVVNDGSIDRTATILQKLESELGIRIVTHASPQGKSVALNDGMRVATS